MKLLLLKLPILFGFIVAACGTQNSTDLAVESVASFEEVADPAQSGQSGEEMPLAERKVIREGEIYFECSDIQETSTFLRNEVSASKGYISNESSDSYGERTERRMSVRIPSDQLDGLLQKIQSHAVHIESMNIRSEDVTEQYIDVEARLKTKKELETRYMELLKQARNVEEILGLERELANVRGEVESMQGRLNYLGDRVALSTLTVSFYVEEAREFGFLKKATEGIGAGWENLQWFVVFLINLWPFVLFFGVLLFWLLRRKKTPPPPMR
ncbi:DUF4349 domain-containing protein [Algoriphagus sp. H41]|uniref:DUF4349 domain-containing protein n=1 Tax=Algoriphagus oliviformis TaxID=2811231 RepID=A0ABS3BXR4_9BACT|nr:DUF4349 domain-containing protein [Algoriphagus oliviformis]MBN7809645.1 DUF4349 domain-containing protein [Algoriphagus oliviformis]